MDLKKLILKGFLVLSLLWLQVGIQAAPDMTLEKGFKLLQASFSLGQQDYFTIWPGFDLRNIPVSLYTDYAAWLINHPAPGPPFFRSDRWLLQWRMYSSHKKPEDFYGNTSLRHNGHLTSILKVLETMTEDRFIELVFHEVFHTYQKLDPRLNRRNGNVLIQPFFPAEDLDYYIMAYIEQLMLKEACLAENEKDSVRFIRLYYTVLAERIQRTSPEYAEFEFEEQINEGLATYAGHLGLKMMGFKRQAEEQFLKLLNTKTISPAGFRHRCYGTGRALAELLDRYEPEWKATFSNGDTLVDRLKRRVPPIEDGNAETTLQLLMTSKLQEEFQWHLKAEKEKRERLRKAVMSPEHVTIRFVGDTVFKNPRIRFDPLNVQRVAQDLLCHTRILQLGKGSRFDFHSRDFPVINRVKAQDLLAITEIIFPLPGDVSISLNDQKVEDFPPLMTVRDVSIQSSSLQMNLKNAQVRRTENGPLIVMR